jgi:hypothetical protein
MTSAWAAMGMSVRPINNMLKKMCFTIFFLLFWIVGFSLKRVGVFT